MYCIKSSSSNERVYSLLAITIAFIMSEIVVSRDRAIFMFFYAEFANENIEKYKDWRGRKCWKFVKIQIRFHQFWCIQQKSTFILICTIVIRLESLLTKRKQL